MGLRPPVLLVDAPSRASGFLNIGVGSRSPALFNILKSSRRSSVYLFFSAVCPVLVLYIFLQSFPPSNQRSCLLPVFVFFLVLEYLVLAMGTILGMQTPCEGARIDVIVHRVF